MRAATCKHLLVASALMSAAMTASALTTSTRAFSDQELQSMLAQSRPAQPGQEAEAASKPTLRIGLSDPNTALVLPWFVGELVDAVNHRTPLRDLAKNLRNGI